jgi:hypothetical protein
MVKFNYEHSINPIMNHELSTMNSTKRYILKPGRHQFAPGSPAIHHNDNLSDEEADALTEEPDPACRVSGEESFKLMGEITPIESVESFPSIGEITKQII